MKSFIFLLCSFLCVFWGLYPYQRKYIYFYFSCFFSTCEFGIVEFIHRICVYFFCLFYLLFGIVRADNPSDGGISAFCRGLWPWFSTKCLFWSIFSWVSFVASFLECLISRTFQNLSFFSWLTQIAD
jgi:hypothetical protein